MADVDSDGFSALAFNPKAGDEKLFVVFELQPVQNEQKSIEAGRPIFEDREMAIIRIPGDSTLTIVEPAEANNNKRRFAKQYAAFKAGHGELLEGTPLEQWPAVTRSMVKELAHFGIRTVEQLANVSDSNIQGIGGQPLALRKRAQDFLEAAKGNAPLEQMREELSKRDEEIAALKAQMQEIIMAQAKAAQSAPPVVEHVEKRGPGRPRGS